MVDARNNFVTGSGYFLAGLRLLGKPELRKYILIPIIINCLLFVSLTSLLIHYFTLLSTWDLSLPKWLAWFEFLEKTLKWVIWLLLTIFVVIAYGYAFNVITNIIAAPFYGLLAQKTEELLTGDRPQDEPIVKMVPRTLGREAQKLLYFVGRGIVVFLMIILFGTIIFLSFLVPIVGAAWGAWSMAIQYVDYPADGHQTPFRRLRKQLRTRLYSSLGFGGAVMAASMIPVFNIIAMPAAVIGGTVFWVKQLSPAKPNNKESNPASIPPPI